MGEESSMISALYVFLVLAWFAFGRYHHYLHAPSIALWAAEHGVTREELQDIAPILGQYHGQMMTRWIAWASPWYVQLASYTGETVFVHVFWPLWAGASFEASRRTRQRYLAMRWRG